MFRRRMDAGAALAEKRTLNQNTPLHTPTPDKMDGAFDFKSSVLGSGAVAGWVESTVTVGGVTVIYAATIATACLDWEQCQISIKPEASDKWIILADDSVKTLKPLFWDGELILRGSWVIRGRRNVVYFNNAVGEFNVLMEKLE